MLSRTMSYLASVKERDPAARSRRDVLFYPGTWAIALHRVAHRLYRARFCQAARLVNHLARFLTGIDIHPGARIGPDFFADHGFAVIGETAVIGANVTIYSGVTLGGSNPVSGKGGKRHPTVGDNVVIGSGAKIIGAITIGSRAKVGANAVVTKDVAPGAVVVGIPARPVAAAGGDGPDGSSDLQQRIAAARAEVVELRRELAELRQAQDLHARESPADAPRNKRRQA